MPTTGVTTAPRTSPTFPTDSRTSPPSASRAPPVTVPSSPHVKPHPSYSPTPPAKADNQPHPVGPEAAAPGASRSTNSRFNGVVRAAVTVARASAMPARCFAETLGHFTCAYSAGCSNHGTLFLARSTLTGRPVAVSNCSPSRSAAISSARRPSALRLELTALAVIPPGRPPPHDERPAPTRTDPELVDAHVEGQHAHLLVPCRSRGGVQGRSASTPSEGQRVGRRCGAAPYTRPERYRDPGR